MQCKGFKKEEKNYDRGLQKLSVEAKELEERIICCWGIENSHPPQTCLNIYVATDVCGGFI